MVRATAPSDDLQKQPIQANWEFVYSDGARHGTTVKEKLHIGRRPGLIEWSRIPVSQDGHIGFKDLATVWNQNSFGGQGSTWSLQMVSSVRFTTRYGDPSREHWDEPDDWNHWMLSWISWFVRLLIMVLNPMSLVVGVAFAVLQALWDVFPRDGEKYAMSEGVNEDALNNLIYLAAASICTVVVAAAWLGAYEFEFLQYLKLWEEESIGIDVMLPRGIQRHFRIQRPVNRGVFFIYVLWCIFLICFSPGARAANTGEACFPWPNTTVTTTVMADSIVMGNAAIMANATDNVTDNTTVITTITTTSVNGSSPLLSNDQCYSREGEEFLCGVDGCSCSFYEELGCVAAPGRPSEECRDQIKPLCAADDSEFDTSGLHDLLLMVSILHCWIAGVLFLVWLLNEVAMLRGWFFIAPVDEEDILPQVAYHKFLVGFRDRPQMLTFVVDVDSDPLQILEILLPGRGRRRGKVMKAPDIHKAIVKHNPQLSDHKAHNAIIDHNPEVSDHKAIVKQTPEVSCDDEEAEDFEA